MEGVFFWKISNNVVCFVAIAGFFSSSSSSLMISKRFGGVFMGKMGTLSDLYALLFVSFASIGLSSSFDPRLAIVSVRNFVWKYMFLTNRPFEANSPA